MSTNDHIDTTSQPELHPPVRRQFSEGQIDSLRQVYLYLLALAYEQELHEELARTPEKEHQQRVA
jgi:hypothetical protein